MGRRILPVEFVSSQARGGIGDHARTQSITAEDYRRAGIGGTTHTSVLIPCQELGFQGTTFFETTNAENTEPEHMALLIHSFHNGIMSSRPHKPRRIAELHLKIIAFCVEP